MAYKYIKRRRYDTETARLVGSWREGEEEGLRVESLYKKRGKGSYFLHLQTGEDGSEWNISLFSEREARTWLGARLGAAAVAAEFGEDEGVLSEAARAVGLTAAELVEKVREKEGREEADMARWSRKPGPGQLGMDVGDPEEPAPREKMPRPPAKRKAPDPTPEMFDETEGGYEPSAGAMPDPAPRPSGDSFAEATADNLLEIADSHRRGLCLVPGPTGTGKSFGMRLAAVGLALRRERRLVWIMGTQHKHLPGQRDFDGPVMRLRPDLDVLSAKDWADRHVLVLEANADGLLRAVANGALGRAPIEVERSPEAVRLKRAARKLEKAKACLSRLKAQGDAPQLVLDSLAKEVSALNEAVRGRFGAERAFRDMLHGWVWEQAKGEVAREWKDEGRKRGPSAAAVQARIADKLTMESPLYDPDWAFIREMYPACRLYDPDVRIVVSTFAKGIRPIDTISERSLDVAEASITSGAVFMIDEFDSTKANLTDMYCDKGKGRPLDLARVPAALSLTHNSPVPENAPIPADRLARLLEDVGRVTRDTVEQTACDHDYYLDGSYDDTGRGYLFFNGGSSVSSVDLTVPEGQEKGAKKKRRFFVHFAESPADRKEGEDAAVLEEWQARRGRYYGYGPSMNEIYLDYARRDDDDALLSVVASKLQGLSTWVATAFAHEAQRYRESGETLGSEQGYSRSERAVVHSLCDHFHLDDDLRDAMVAKASAMTWRMRRAGKVEANDGSFYANGCRVLTVENNDEHMFRTLLRQVSVDQAAEAFPERLARHALVFGVSATARFPTVLGNYDLEWIAQMLGELYLELTPDQKRRLDEAWERTNEGDGRGVVRYEPVFPADAADMARKEEELVGGRWDQIYGSEDWADMARATTAGMEPYVAARYQRVVSALAWFLRAEGPSAPRAMMCLTSPAPKASSQLDPDIVRRLAMPVALEALDVEAEGEAAHSLGFAALDEVLVTVRDTEEYELMEKGIGKRLFRGDRVFLMASYNTMSRGVNLQYPFRAEELEDGPDGPATVVRSRRAFEGMDRKVDWDCAYIDRVTNVTPFVGLDEDLSEERIARLMTQMASLFEAGQVTSEELNRFVRSMSARKPGVALKDSDAARGAVALAVCQALGRLERTPYRRPVMTILYDPYLMVTMSRSAHDPELCSPLFKGLVEAFERARVPESTPSEAHRVRASADRANQTANYLASSHSDMVRKQAWSAEARELWEGRRMAALRRPVLDGEEGRHTRGIWIDVYEDTDRYQYVLNDPDAYLSRVFTPALARIRGETAPMGAKWVSAESARLAQLMEAPGARGFFEANGFATEWKAGRWLLAPAMFNNVYKGALGEAVGWYLLTAFGLMDGEAYPRLLDIDDSRRFERFDFCVEGRSAYLDMKHKISGWEKPPLEDLAHVLEKMADIGAARVVVCNVLRDPHDGSARDWDPFANVHDGSEVAQEYAGLKVAYVDWLYDPVGRELADERIRAIRDFFDDAPVSRDSVLGLGANGVFKSKAAPYRLPAGKKEEKEK